MAEAIVPLRSLFREVLDPPRAPTPRDLCRCGHQFQEHKGAEGEQKSCQFRSSSTAGIPTGPKCECKEFGFRYLGSGLPEEKRIDKIMSDIVQLEETKRGAEITLQDLERILIAAFKIPAEFIKPEPPPKTLTLPEVLKAAAALRDEPKDPADRDAYVRLKQAVIEQRQSRLNIEANELDAPRAGRAKDDEEI